MAGLSYTSGDGLETAVKQELWPTPTSSMMSSKGGGQGRVGKERPSLAKIVTQDWATPTARDHNHGSGYPERPGRPLSVPIAVFPGVLNPAFVEILCGFPEGWTDISGLPDEEKNNSPESLPEPSPPEA